MENKVWEVKLGSDFCPYKPNRFKPITLSSNYPNPVFTGEVLASFQYYVNVCEFAKPYSQDCTFDNCPIKASKPHVEADVKYCSCSKN